MHSNSDPPTLLLLFHSQQTRTRTHTHTIYILTGIVAERTHQTLEDVWGENGLARTCEDATRYYRFNPLLGGPNDFPIDTTDPQILDDLTKLTEEYLQEPKQQRMLKGIADVVNPPPRPPRMSRWRRRVRQWLS